MKTTKKIIYSSDTGKYAFGDIKELSKQSEYFFETKDDPEQFQITPNNTKWIYTTHPDWVNIATHKGKFVGGAFCFPIKKSDAKEFVKGGLSEKKLFSKTKKSIAKSNAIYLCSVLVLPKYRHQGIGSTLVKKLIRETSKGMRNPPIVYWEYPTTKKIVLTEKRIKEIFL